MSLKKKIHYGFPNKVNGLWTGAVCGVNGEFITDVREKVNCQRCIRTFSIMSTVGLFKPNKKG